MNIAIEESDSEKIARLEADNERLRTALAQYGGHNHECTWRTDRAGPCNCGWEEAMSPRP